MLFRKKKSEECAETIKKETQPFLKSNWKKLTFYAGLAAGMYIFIYFCFCGKGIIPAGDGLSKEAWLAFLGTYLAFVGTIAVALVASLQSRFYANQEKQRRLIERKKQIQPIFSIKIEAIDSQIDGTSDMFNPYKRLEFKHKNIKLSIKNVNSYPVKHLIICEKYITPLLESGEKISVQCAYWDSEDAQKWPDKVIILTDDCAKGEKDCPSWFNVMYEDVDGASMYQTFKLKKFDETLYYSLDCQEDIS